MQISYNEGLYYLGSTKYTKEDFIKYVEDDFLAYALQHEPTSTLDVKEKDDSENKDDKNDIKYKQIIFYGVPGCGKSYRIDKELEDLGIIIKDENGTVIENTKASRTKRIVFHPEYTNADFIGQILPKLQKQEKKDKPGEYEDVITYSFTPGPFTEILTKAYLDNKHNYALIIEEINRGNAAAIFGELFQLLDRFDDDFETVNEFKYEFGWSSYCVNNDLIIKEIKKAYNKDLNKSPYLPLELVKKYGLNIGIRLPPNLSIFATMNTSDQNVFKLDNAFKRRWQSQLIPNKFGVSELEKAQENAIIDGFNFTWGAFRAAVNNYITNPANDNENNTFSDKQLGTWFIKNINGQIKNNEFTNKVLEYLWDDVFTDDYTIFDKTICNTFESVVEKSKTEERLDIFITEFKDEIEVQQQILDSTVTIEDIEESNDSELQPTEFTNYLQETARKIDKTLSIVPTNYYYGFKRNDSAFNFLTIVKRKNYYVAEFYIDQNERINDLVSSELKDWYVGLNIDKNHCNRESYKFNIPENSLDKIKEKEENLLEIIKAAYDKRSK